ncbi:MAG: pyridoxal-phosphate-dependent aminotransferase family protein [Hyphomicrobiaceae bacterium]
MTLRNGRQFMAIPGPTTVPDEVLAAMQRPAIDIYTGELNTITDTCLADLKRLFRTEAETYIYIANGHGGWEAALTNTLSRGDKVLVLESGLFAVGWGEVGRMIGIEVEVLKGGWNRAVDPAVLEARLRAEKAGEIKAVLVVQIDTASSVVNDIPALRRAIDAAGHDALFMVDTIASLGCMPFEMDDWGVDLCLTGAQKGLMCPPGLAFLAAGKRAKQAHAVANLRTFYWDWTFRDGPLHYQKYCGTPPEHLLFALRKSFDLLFAEGLENAWRRHRMLAAATHAAVTRWAQAGAISFNIASAQQRSASVTTVLMDDPQPLLDFTRETCGTTLGLAIGELSGKAIRIAHMGHCNAPMLLGTLGVIELGLKHLGIAHGEGGPEAAIASLAKDLQS